MNLRTPPEHSKSGLFFRTLMPFRSRSSEPIRLPGLELPEQDPKLKKILIVDDDAVILKTLSLKLKNAGYAVVTATDGADALRVMREEKPNLLVLDICFPPDVAHGGGVPWDGFILMRWLNAMRKESGLPVIFITACATASFRDKAAACGALGLFEKPIDHVRFVELIQKALPREAAPSEPNAQNSKQETADRVSFRVWSPGF